MADIKAEIRSPTIRANVYRATIPVSGDVETYQGEYAVTPSSEEQTLQTKGLIMRRDVTVHSIPDDYIIPIGDIDIVENGEVDISHYKTANVNVPIKYDEGYRKGYDSGYSEGFEASQETIVLQEKTVTENGDVTADEGFTGLSKVNVAIPIKEEQTKSLTITENGTHKVLPDENKVLSSVRVDVDVKDETLVEIETTIDESGVLDSTEGTVEKKVEQLVGKAELSRLLDGLSTFGFGGNKTIEVVDFYFDTLIGVYSDTFRDTPALKKIKGFNTSATTRLMFTFYESGIEIIEEPFDLSNLEINPYNHTFVHAYNLVEIRIVPETLKINCGFASSKLSTNSIQSIINGLATVETQQKLTFNTVVVNKLTDEQKVQILLKNWEVG